MLCNALSTAQEGKGGGPLPERASFPVSVAGKWGYVDREGNAVIEPTRKGEAKDFQGDVAWVKTKALKPAVEMQGATAYVQPDLWGLIDTAGRFVCPPRFSKVRDFREGLALIEVGGRHKSVTSAFSRSSTYSAGKWGFVSRKGTVAIEPTFLDARDFSESLAPVVVGGEWVSPLGVVGGKWGYIDTDGKFAIPASFDNARSFSEGLALVNVGGEPRRDYLSLDYVLSKFVGGKWGYVDRDGEFAIDASYTQAESFSEGLAAVRVGGEWKRELKYKGAHAFDPDTYNWELNGGKWHRC